MRGGDIDNPNRKGKPRSAPTAGAVAAIARDIHRPIDEATNGDAEISTRKTSAVMTVPSRRAVTTPATIYFGITLSSPNNLLSAPSGHHWPVRVGPDFAQAQPFTHHFLAACILACGSGKNHNLLVSVDHTAAQKGFRSGGTVWDSRQRCHRAGVRPERTLSRHESKG
jgi:hypothetical protein